MAQDFEQYLTEKKNNNEYSSDVQSNFLTELFGFGNKKDEKPCISVTIDFTNDRVVNHIADSVKGSDNIKDAIKKTIVDYIADINYAFKNTDGNLFARGLENGALRYYFKKYSRKTPEGNANDFISRIDTNLDMSFIKNSAVVKDDTYSDAEKENLESSLNALNPPKDLVKQAKANKNSEVFKQALKDSKFIGQIIEKITKPISKKLENEKTIEDNGELKQVYCAPFKISETLIKKCLDDANTLNDFWYNITADVANKMLNALENVDDMINSYIGFAPIKTYGFNIYFTDMDAAEQFAEQLTEEGKPEITSRKRYANKIAKYPQLLQQKNEEIGGRTLAAMDDPIKYFMNTMFAKEKIEPVIKEKFPDADDATLVRRYSIKCPKEIIDAIMQKHDTDLVKCYNDYIKPIIEPFFKLEEFIGAGSEKDTFEFIFTRNASVDSIKDQLINSLKIDRTNIRVEPWVLTQKEIKAASEYIRNDNTAANNFKSFISEILNNGAHNKIELSALELTLPENTRKTLVSTRNDANPDRFKGVVKTIIEAIENKFMKAIDSCIGFIFNDDYKVTVYFKDDSGVAYAKEHYKADDEFTIGSSGKVTVSNTELKRIKELHLSDGLYKSVDKSIEDAQNNTNNKWYTYAVQLTLPRDILVRDLRAAYDAIPDNIRFESFKAALFGHLLTEMNIVNEDGGQTLFQTAKNWLYNNENANNNVSTIDKNIYEKYSAILVRAKIGNIIEMLKRNYSKVFKFEPTSMDSLRTGGTQLGIIKCHESIKESVDKNLVKPINDSDAKNIVQIIEVTKYQENN